MQPSVFIKNFCGCFFIFIITGHHIFTTYKNFSDSCLWIRPINFCFHNIQNLSGGFRQKIVEMSIADKRCTFCHTVSNGKREFNLVEKLFHFCIQRSTTNYNL